ncbi:Inhibitor of growth protein 3 [Pseudocercospora fuligena]|uniref:Inhibitor of growth protein 3 n=1 Tax=Pseudocercospora fuligena TaxID=685502 RepID=A0A8H6R9I7_9PEZI|nr:Inhibitor of growth protein 3 [Pseudocercospora fuligena]
MASTAITLPAVDQDFRSLSRRPPSDPDIQATLSDFLTYTEHFPSHLTRALTLVHEQRAKAEAAIRSVHENTTAYSILPSIKHARPDPVKLRRDISLALEEAESACRMSVEEAVRLDDECQREAKRLDIVAEKLKAQPKPPSRDPTPEQQALTSPNLKRERRMSTRADDGRMPEKQSRRVQDKAASKLKGRKIMVPGEVLPPPDPNAPASESVWSSPRPSPPLLEEPIPETVEKKKGATPRPRSRTPKPPKTDKEKKESSRKEDRDADRKTPKPRGPRAPGQPGTNAHSAVAGISTSNALLALKEPPADAAKGSKWLPWVKLTEWEMAKLRKRMKKNAIWVPSQTMVRRELKNLGRGIAGKEAARAEAEAGGTEFVDEHNETDPTKVEVSGEEAAQMTAMLGPPQVYADDDDADAELINRGMRLNEAKKLKRQRLLEEQALQAQLAREQGVEPPSDGKTNTASPEGQKKRKREMTPAAGSSKTADPVSPEARPQLKKIKINPPSRSETTSKVPLAPAGASSSPKAASQRNRRAATPPATKKPTLTLKLSKAVSEEPPNRRASLRRSSNASLPSGSHPSTNTPTSPKSATLKDQSTTKSGRRTRRPAPGVITTNDDESAKVGVSQRKAAPRKRGQNLKKDSAAPPDPLVTLEPEEVIDPDEPRYCICGDVSWGTMIACDNDDCEKEWFHLDCVALTDLPPRRTKWYCPDCRKKLKQGQSTNGLVGRNVGTGAR